MIQPVVQQNKPIRVTITQENGNMVGVMVSPIGNSLDGKTVLVLNRTDW